MPDSVYEVTVTTRDAQNREHKAEAEYTTSATTPKDAAEEIRDFLGDALGGRFRPVNEDA